MSKGLAHPGIAIRVPDHPDALRAVKALQVMHELIPRFTDIVRTSAEDDGLQVVVRPGWPAPCTDGARVMLTTNLGTQAGLTNGLRRTVHDIV